MSNTHDALVIGGGHNGLVSAAYLARSGARTLVLEGRGSRGGAATVMVAGKLLMRNGTLVRASETDVLRSSQQAAESLAARSGLERFARSAWHHS